MARYGKMIAQAESAVALDKLKKEAVQNRKEVKEAMAKVRAEGRAGSAPAAPSRRLQADLDAGVHPRAAKKAGKHRQRAASRIASWKRFARSVHGQGTRKILEISLNLQSHASWSLSAIEEDI